MRARKSKGIIMRESGASISPRRHVMKGRSSRLNAWIRRVVTAIIVVVVGSMVGVLVTHPRSLESEPSAAVAAGDPAAKRSAEAYAARTSGLAGHYLKAERATAAYGARYRGMAEHYAMEVSGVQRVIRAYAARETGIAQHYLGATSASQRGMEAYAARYEELARQYLGRSHSSDRAISAYAARCTGIAEQYGATEK